jgi:prepilin-type N-terminal cleavage/methylation domain-containing protein
MRSHRCEGTIPASARRRRLGAEGFSLVELMIAITLIGIGILSLAMLFPVSMRKVNRGDLESRATFQAEAKIEELKRTPWANLVTAASADTVETVFVRNWTVQVDSPVQGMKTVSVTVNWADGQGPRSILLSSYLSNSGM